MSYVNFKILPCGPTEYKGQEPYLWQKWGELITSFLLSISIVLKVKFKISQLLLFLQFSFPFSIIVYRCMSSLRNHCCQVDLFFSYVDKLHFELSLEMSLKNVVLSD